MTKIRSVKIGNVSIGGGDPLALVAGPCVIESQKSCLRNAERLKRLCDKKGVPLVFKSSYDKANRSSVSSFRGPGLKKGLEVLKSVKKELGLAVLSDVHSASDVSRAQEVLDCLQIPAFLSRQTDLLIAAAKTRLPVNIKKGQFSAPWNMQEAIKKIESRGNRSILLTERGVSFGYNNLVVDFRGLEVMKEFGYPVVFDATHSVQLPGAKGNSSGGERQYVGLLSRAAVAVGCHGLFLEVHEDPDRAPCDGPNMVSFEMLDELLDIVLDIDKIVVEKGIRR